MLDESIILKLGKKFPSSSDFAENTSKSSLKSVDTLLKDKSYRGKSAKRKDLFEGPRIMDNSTYLEYENSESDFEGSATEDDEEGTSVSDQGGVNVSREHFSSASSVLSNGSESESEEGETQDGDNHSRHDKVRKLLAQETRYFLVT